MFLKFIIYILIISIANVLIEIPMKINKNTANDCAYYQKYGK